MIKFEFKLSLFSIYLLILEVEIIGFVINFTGKVIALDSIQFNDSDFTKIVESLDGLCAVHTIGELWLATTVTG